jgi:putative ABC transport system permease protein
LKPDQVSVIFIKVKKGFDPYAVGRAVEGETVEVDVVARKDIGKNIIGALKDIRQMFSIMVVLASLLSIFLAWSVFSAIANERSREVGIMRALGAKESHVVRIFLIEVLMIAIAGSLVGIASGSILSVFLEKSFTILKSLSTELYALERFSIAAVGLCAGTAVCVLGALSPILRIKKMEPLAAIKEG